MDEAFVEADGKRYVIFTEDNLNLTANTSITIDGKAAHVIKLSNEINSFGEGLSYVPLKGYDVVKSALEPLVPNATTGFAMIAGVTAGALARHSFSPSSNVLSKYSELEPLGVFVTKGIGFAAAIPGAHMGQKFGDEMTATSGEFKDIAKAAGSLGGGLVAGFLGNGLAYTVLINTEGGLSKTSGIGIATGALFGVAATVAASDQTSKSTGTKQAKALATSAGSLAVGVAAPEIIELVSKIRIPEIAVKSAKMAGVAVLVGGTMASAGLAAAGALKSVKNETIDEIAK